MAEPRTPKNIPVREKIAADDPPVAAPGDANPDLQRPSTPGPVPASGDPNGAREHAGPSEAATADIEERQKGHDDDHGRAPADAPPYR
jgi:hypothetical protein